MIRCKRAYEAPSADDGQRVLVDRLWPRGQRKERLKLADWAKEAAPSTELRHAFHEGKLDFVAFAERYRQELNARPAYWWPLLERARQGDLTLVYAGKDTESNNARVLADWLEDELERQGPSTSPVCYADFSPSGRP